MPSSHIWQGSGEVQRVLSQLRERRAGEAAAAAVVEACRRLARADDDAQVDPLCIGSIKRLEGWTSLPR